MSIIEKAMQKLNGGRVPSRRPAMTGLPKVVEHPASQKITQQPNHSTQASLRPSPTVEPSTTHRTTRRRIAGRTAGEQLTYQVTEEFRRIKRPLLANAYGKGALKVDRGNLIMVTSSVPGEGKSTTSANLANSIALEPDRTVLLIDADVAKAQVSRTFGLQNEPGLTNILTEGLHPEALIWSTENNRLNVLPVGSRRSESAELLNSDRMEQLVAALAERDPNRVIIFDAPPLLATNEPQILARMVGQIVLVVEAGRTPQHVVQEAIATLDPAKAIGLVLNKGRYSIGGDYYGHYYGGYHYGYGAEPANEGNNKGAGK